MEHLYEVLAFAGKFLIVVLALGAVLLMVLVTVAKTKMHPALQVERLDEHLEKIARQLKHSLISSKDLKAERKALKKREKEKENDDKPHTFVLDFKGDIKAAATEQLREEVSAVVGAAKSGDEVILRLESPGGMVHGYGLAAAELLRLKKAGLRLTVCVDKVAASGGYLMACVADRIIAAPFAIIGSIGVVAQVPNLNRLLKKHDVDYKEYTAGEYKRTVSFLGEITPKGEEKFREQLEETHVLFKEFVQKNRPKLDIPKVATGEHWYGMQAIDLGLIDEVSTSDELLQTLSTTRALVHLKLAKKETMSERLSGLFTKAVRQGIAGALEDLEARRW